ncbi:hypothetical protein GUITHDRAFT_93321 [Guillardia theta CCMP2712]|uniref:Metallo-beta-lactamase domain-containing protein n=1 Tax=Guillardia theta (strain CCMP2712) TaxID=905079 RepID=L1JL48_GUITC|nr:hypothetical protein GUITHDRAFT_93321 [Guillardia theta CCMP2712]EKX49246.1 hypothetical protein GUITHDRAFT_93321 [Guillardia theta CCMP2712]|eukprot:XP_005836226.1 hypothetical protein GUITHDRAFT_93321 [Guillardia theta CCMP2712]
MDHEMFKGKAFKVLKFMYESKTKRASLPSQEELDKYLPLSQTNWNLISAPPPSSITLTWIGHSSFLVQIGGLNFLTDPVFSNRASPVPFMGPWRYAKLPFGVEKLPKIDFVVISHSHYDHLDLDTVRKLGNGPVWYVGLGLKEWFLGEGITNVVEMDWWQSVKFGKSNVEVEDSEPWLLALSSSLLQITCTPCQHWSARTPFDACKTLWCSWVVRDAGGPTFFFAGDTAHCPVFEEIRRRVGKIHCSLIPIGAYLPRKFMKDHHASPEDAVQIHLALGSSWSVGCHWGTLRQKALEHVLDPPKVVQAELERRKMKPTDFEVMKHGETRGIVVQGGMVSKI